jgi:hypothetical protein
VPGFAAEDAGWSQLGEAPGGAITVGATCACDGIDGGAQVDAIPAGRGGVAVDCGIGEDGRIGGPDFLRFLRWRVLSSMTAATSAAKARSISAYAIGIGWRASLSPNPAIYQLQNV